MRWAAAAVVGLPALAHAIQTPDAVGEGPMMQGMLVGGIVLVLTQVAIVTAAVVWFRRSRLGDTSED